MLIVIAGLLVLVLVSLWWLGGEVRAARHGIFALVADHRTNAASDPEERERQLASWLNAQWAGEGLLDRHSLGELLHQTLKDVGIIKRRLYFIHQACYDLRSIRTYLEHHWQLDPFDLDREERKGINSAIHQLERLQESEEEYPLTEEREAMTQVVAKWVLEEYDKANEDDFERVLGSRLPRRYRSKEASEE